MSNADSLAGNPDHGNSAYCFAKPGEIYLVYLPQGSGAEIDLGESETEYVLYWFNPRQGGEMIRSEKSRVKGPGKADLGRPPSQENEDWLAVLRKKVGSV